MHFAFKTEYEIVTSSILENMKEMKISATRDCSGYVAMNGSRGEQESELC